MKSLLAHYNKAVKSQAIVSSEHQKQVLAKLELVRKSVIQGSRSWWPFGKKQTKGVYIHGPVGAGKTYLMNLFYEHVPETCKQRFHFHHFMQNVDKSLRARQGHMNPLKHIAKALAEKAHVLCLDEFLVEDVADASILGELLSELFKHGVILIATANTNPDDLYLDGLHRERFLPAIDLINQHCEVVCLDEHKDYRLGRKSRPEVYLYPVSADNEALMQMQFEKLSGQEEHPPGTMMIQDREVNYIAKDARLIWFDFQVICNMPRSQLDYLEIAKSYDAVFVSHVPALKPDELGQLSLFIRFVDVMYDEGIHLIVLSEVPMEAIYIDGPMKKSFERTLSRLQEMHSSDYWQRGRELYKN